MTLAGVVSLLILNSPVAHAEGIVQMGLGQRLLDHQEAITQNFASDDASASMFVDILNIGEVINVALCGRNQTDNISIEFYAPSNDVTPVYTNYLTEGNTSCTDLMTAPLTMPECYTTLETGTYRLVLQNTTYTGIHDSLFERYDITVTPDALTDPDPTLEECSCS